MTPIPPLLTLMAVHAHPDDEVITTGGILAKYATEGITTVLVTCTDGDLGDAPVPRARRTERDRTAVAALRRAELEESCRILGVGHLELLGYRDSGMASWETNNAPGAFWAAPVPEAAGRLAVLLERYRPQVVVTYDPHGLYGHPDHIQTHRVTMAALDMVGLHPKVYCPAIRRSRLQTFLQSGVGAGVELSDVGQDIHLSSDDEIDATIDCRDSVAAKIAALRAHASQADNLFFLGLPPPQLEEIFGIEEFTRLRDPTGTPTFEADLFGGLRLPATTLHRDTSLAL